jgi:thiamine pyrophosphate-dependent acetolactate synthase large subunit-like protein
MIGAPTSSVPVLSRRSADPDALIECADEIIERLSAAKGAAIIVDVEIRRYNLEERVTTLARKLGLPVVSTFMGRGLLEQAPDVEPMTQVYIFWIKQLSAASWRDETNERIPDASRAQMVEPLQV